MVHDVLTVCASSTREHKQSHFRSAPVPASATTSAPTSAPAVAVLAVLTIVTVLVVPTVVSALGTTAEDLRACTSARP